MTEQKPNIFLRDFVSLDVLEFEDVTSGASMAVLGQLGLPLYSLPADRKEVDSATFRGSLPGVIGVSCHLLIETPQWRVSSVPLSPH